MGTLFYSIDLRLIDLIQEQAPAALEPALLSTERSAGQQSGNHDSQVGTWNDRPVLYRFLAQPPSLIGSVPASLSGDPSIAPWWNPAKIQYLEDKINWSNLMSTAYCGWLVSNARFIREHDDFFATFQIPIRALGRLPPLDDRDSTISPSLQPCRAAYAALCAKWELAGLAGPYLPIPLQPQLPVAPGAIDLLPALARAGGVFIYLPRTHPTPSREKLRELIEDALSRTSAPDHLKEWMDLIDANNPGKKRILRYVRLFRLQHWWRLIHHRHGATVIGQIEKLQKALAIFLIRDDPDDKHFETIRDELTFLKTQLGQGWHSTPNALRHFR